MANYNPLIAKLVKELETIVGAKNVTVDPEKLETYSHDEETDKRYQHMQFGCSKNWTSTSY